MLTIKKVRSLRQLFNVYSTYQKSFPASEKKPFSMVLKARRQGNGEIFCIEDSSKRFVGLAIVVLYQDMVLLDYFAISEKLRGKGAGSEALRLLQKQYTGKRLFLEIESTLEECEDLTIRQRRKDFYLRNGMSEDGVEVFLFGVRMELLVYECKISFEEYHAVYRQILPKMLLCNVQEYTGK